MFVFPKNKKNINQHNVHSIYQYKKDIGFVIARNDRFVYCGLFLGLQWSYEVIYKCIHDITLNLFFIPNNIFGTNTINTKVFKNKILVKSTFETLT